QVPSIRSLLSEKGARKMLGSELLNCVTVVPLGEITQFDGPCSLVKRSILSKPLRSNGSPASSSGTIAFTSPPSTTGRISPAWRSSIATCQLKENEEVPKASVRFHTSVSKSGPLMISLGATLNDP